MEGITLYFCQSGDLASVIPRRAPAERNPNPMRMDAEQVRRSIALETGLTEDRVREIVSLIGLDRASVLREVAKKSQK
ncbi:hypothetical protein [Mesorhizobium mediterraneum]|jgi:hypothetical protein|uniref:hypothetical protein n=1 Tax=Mesorhizobium mediterraneum TaxID=43617 RepID=UPI001786FE2B|nr:hypothetical protein [Mesorhizobium mediterraneum]